MKDQLLIELHSDGMRESQTVWLNGTRVENLESLSMTPDLSSKYTKNEIILKIREVEVTIKEYYKGKEVIPTCRTI